ncbi:sensor histidine kinase [Bacillus cereus]|uniref:sensor histidine kinase n=1 Tax=Bacillus cereus TaxID=1396 RepID=UPI00084C3717|nr:ATP-binding protein [Bacillus cereus]MCM3201611.1 ATP-binding protein [Bacillus cereus]MDN4100454.1 sensor histidine kinase [Bacillus cereus]OED06645.1 hypothetical protein A9756_26635 [Bacillus cereus]OJE14569.1 hypothetical protein A9488_08875 [Bacillus cereus]
MKKHLYLKVNARHVGQLGRELVTDFVTALVELVKNSYDADSPAVKITFDNVKTSTGKIIIIDSGTGMTQNDVEDKWTVIGTNSKVRNSHSPKGRKFAGKKGIGRFSVERLAEKMTMYSFPGDEPPFKFTINWNKYEEINSLAMEQRLQRLLHDPEELESAKYVCSHVDYFLSNKNIEDIDKIFLKDELLVGYSENYTYFINNNKTIELLLENFIPLLKKYQTEEVRIQDIVHELELLNEEEKQLYKDMIFNLNEQVDIHEQKPVTGLIMVLEGLRDQWKQKELLKVQKELRLLVAPNFLEKDAFIPILNAPEFELEDEVIVNDILDLKYAKIEAEVTNNGKIINISYTDKINGKLPVHQLEQNPPLLCGNLNLELYYFVRDKENLSNEIINLRHARHILDQFCGIKIYRDGFHIKPYGDIGNDWLLLDQNKIKDTHGYLVGNNQVVGVIKISEEFNPLLIDATNREAIIENDAFDSLKEVVITCTNYISEKRRIEYDKEKKYKSDLQKEIEKEKEKEEQRRKEDELREEARKKDFENKKKQLDALLKKRNITKKNLAKVSQLAVNIQEQTEQEVHYYKERMKEEIKKTEEFQKKTEGYYQAELLGKEREISLYKNLATLGMLTGAFGHETADIINRISADIYYTKKWFPVEITVQKPGVVEAYNQIFNDLDRVQGYSSLISGFIKKEKRVELGFVNYKQVIENITNIYNNIIKSQNINIELQLNDFESCFKMYMIDFESVIINLLTNGFEALKNTSNKLILIKVNNYESYQELIFTDNGPGIRKGYEKLIFSPFITNKPEGIGLGLSIVKDVVEKYKGTIYVQNSTEYGGAEFHIQFPKED